MLHWFRGLFACIMIFVSLCLGGLVAVAQVPPGTPLKTIISGTKTPLPKDLINSRKEEIKKEITVFSASVSGKKDLPGFKSAIDSVQSAYDELLLAVEQQQNELDSQKGLKEELERLNTEYTQLTRVGLPANSLHSLTALDDLKDKYRTEKAALDLVKKQAEKVNSTVEDARTDLSDKEATRRLTKEETQSTPIEDRFLSELRLKKDEVSSRVARENVTLRWLERSTREEQLQVATARVKLLELKIHLSSKNIVFSRSEFDEQLMELERQEYELTQDLESAKLAVKALEQKWLSIKGAVLTQATKDTNLEERASTYQKARELKQIEVSALTERIQRIRDMKRLWQRRFDAYTAKASEADLRAWIKEADTDLENLDRDIKFENSKLEDLRKRSLSLGQMMQSQSSEQSEIRGWLETQQSDLSNAIKVIEGEVASLATLKNLNLDLLNDLGANEPSASVKDVVVATTDKFKSFWTYELTSIDDHPITLGKVLSAIVLLSLGIWLSRKVSNFLGHFIFPKLGIKNGAQMAFQSLLFYFLIIGCALFALRLVNVPLTFFTVIGGALAIGVGFGSQNIMSNFISGLIMLIEQHVRVGDMVEVNDLKGSVKHVGLRSTIVRTADNIDIVVPNSAFLDKQVVNWTLADNIIRISVSVGVAYGSPLELVSQLLMQAAEENLHVLNNPQAIVLFANFGDSSLVFELYAYVFLNSLIGPSIVKSELRYKINELFKENGIEIAFPTREVNLSVRDVVKVNIVRNMG